MRRLGRAERRVGRRRSAPRAKLFGLLIAAAIVPFATTSIARQDATSLMPKSADARALGPGRYLAAVPRRPIELASLEAADLFGSGRGPMATPDLLDGGALMVLDLPLAETPGGAKSSQPMPFVDRTVKGDRAPIRLTRAGEPAVVMESDPFAALPLISAALALDLTGLDMLPRPGALVGPKAAQNAWTTPKPPADGALQDRAPSANDEDLLESAGLTAVPMTPREGGWRHDGSTPSVADMNGGRVPDTATPPSEPPLAVAALPVVPSPGAGHVIPLERGRTRGHVALAPSTDASPEGETVASRGDLDGDGRIETRLSHRVMIPEAQLARAEQCLAEAVYFEARGEPKEGQYAVAQVVMNRVRSGYYPSDVCGVVYQNVHRRNACQFSFACDRIPDRVSNRHAWNLASAIAKDVTRGGAFLPEVGDSTHYHANYVRPNWIRDMVKEDRIGRHIFYRVRWRGPIGA